MASIKPGVRIHGIGTEMVLAFYIIAEVYREFGVECVITSGIEGTHSLGSEHYKGDALDFRTRDATKTQAFGIAEEVKKRLGDHFDVVLEGNHLHVEYDPKTPF